MKISEPDRKLINEGAIQYFDALRALREFRELVLGLCADVMEKRSEALAKAMGAPIDIESSWDSVWPDKNEQLFKPALWRTAWIGRYLPFPDFGNAYWGIVCGPEGRRGGEVIIVTALMGYEAKTKAIRDRALSRFKKAGVARIENLGGNEVDIRQRLDSGEIDRFPEVLDRMTDEWIKIWEYVGGLLGIAEAAASRPHSKALRANGT